MRNKLLATTLICGLSAITSLAYGGGGSIADTPQAAMIEMVKIPGGTFIMGSPKDEPKRWDDEIQHRVTVDSFYMGKYQVTEEQYEAVTGNKSSDPKRANHPIWCVTWYDAVEFCNKLSKREGLEPVYTITVMEDWNDHIEEATVKADWSRNGYRLPTEAEWEYACRAGTETPFNTGDNITTAQANYDKDRKKGEFTTPVGSFAPNAWGLYDMHGNLDEWCWDWYGDYYMPSFCSIPEWIRRHRLTQINPKGPASGSSRVTRGGSWGNERWFSRSASRDKNKPGTRLYNVGFRVARN